MVLCIGQQIKEWIWDRAAAPGSRNDPAGIYIPRSFSTSLHARTWSEFQVFSLPFVVHVEEFADELVDGVLGLQLDVHGEEEGREEEDGAREADQLGRAQLAGLVLVRVVRPIGPATLK